MKCKICEKYFINETRFKNLFVFEEVCKDCEKTYNISPKLEVYPMNDGLIQYYYLYDDLLVNIKQLTYLEKYYKNIFEICFKKTDDSLLIIVDKYSYEELKNDLFLLEPFKRIIIVSLIRYNFEDFVFFL